MFSQCKQEQPSARPLAGNHMGLCVLHCEELTEAHWALLSKATSDVAFLISACLTGFSLACLGLGSLSRAVWVSCTSPPQMHTCTYRLPLNLAERKRAHVERTHEDTYKR